jgi:hypothetical protein
MLALSLCAFAGPAQIAAHADRSVKPCVHQRPAVEAMRGQRSASFALWTVVRSVTIRVGNLLNILLDRANERV